MAKTKQHGFWDKLREAEPKEAELINELRVRYPITFGDLIKDGGRGSGDAVSPSSGALVELKIDFTDHKNHFVERYSNLDTKKDGGPWAYHFCNYYIYKYNTSGDIHVFDPVTLVEFLEQINQIDKIFGKRVFQKGAGYTTFGYAIPKIILKHLELTDKLT